MLFKVVAQNVLFGIQLGGAELSVVKIDLTNSQANMTAGCKSDSCAQCQYRRGYIAHLLSTDYSNSLSFLLLPAKPNHNRFLSEKKHKINFSLSFQYCC